VHVFNVFLKLMYVTGRESILPEPALYLSLSTSFEDTTTERKDP